MKTHEHILIYTSFLPFLPVLHILFPSSVLFFLSVRPHFLQLPAFLLRHNVFILSKLV